ncbi:5'-nucleotidase, lipoprotein e(P4) family [Paenibacillus sp. BSR1-1]|uniref:5'-nucleotidase, lipoprotein e(P4) family n=1 Tax=Paenibacillus sp. BSR1-1 TaxID=3020845 RepID=UPI0025B00079|nr:5'-nucleotidase, lipoprotein e(P4) family [Paenibacillus sp. BSR1-1]MDN3018790.1 5'-nucleotidase, lipoprotein e(P4) family [Paenibacillus sp. BSR1-1]
MKKSKMLCITALTLFFSFSCDQAESQTIINPLQEQNTMSVLWFQKAGEARALFYQGYNIGRMRLDDILSKKQWKQGLKPAIVLDLDETVIDNSPLFAKKIMSPPTAYLNWGTWVERSAAEALPGAIDFLKYADSKGVAIYYISNRKEALKAATIRNLQNIGAPQADAAHVLLKQKGERGKEARRMQVAKTHDIVLLFGDNLGDFSGFEGLSVTQRAQMADKQRYEFGRKLIVFPNPMYGDWEGAIYQYDSRRSDLEKAKLRKDNLEPFQP